MKLLFMIFFLIAVNFVSDGEETGVSKQIPERADGKIRKAEKLIAKGAAIMKEALKYDEQIKENEENGKSGKIRKLSKKSVKIKLKAAPYFEDGYKKKAKAYQKLISDAKKTNPQLASRLKEIEVKSKNKIKVAKKYYRKANDASSKSKSVELYENGHRVIKEAIEQLEGGVKLVYGLPDEEQDTENETEEENTGILSSDSISMQSPVPTEMEGAAAVTSTSETAVVTASAVSVEDEKTENEISSATDGKDEVVSSATEEIVEPVAAPVVPAAVVDSVSSNVDVEEKSVGDVFYTIQFIADKKPVSEEVLRSKYSGDLEIVKMESDGWFRYSAGRFSDLDEAKRTMVQQNIKGYIVAYNKNQRISLKEAKELLNKN